MFTTIRHTLKAHQKRRQTIFELSRLTDRELSDLGISRCDIRTVASGQFQN